MAKAKTKFAGRHLWKALLQGGGNIWITTGVRDIAQAVKVAKRFAATTTDPFLRGRTVRSVKYRGTLDA